MRTLLFILILIGLVSCGGTDCCNPHPGPEEKPLIKGVDISFLPEMEAAGVKFYDATGTEKDMLDILKSQGINTIRVRVWHTPATTHSSLAEVKAFADRIHAKDMDVWLTVHYSDTWADPGHQQKPAAWSSLSYPVLQDSVYRYTKKVMAAINPEIIQIGNEINGGLLLPEGSTGTVSNFVGLLKKGVQAVRETSADTQIMIHVAGFDVADWIYEQLATNAVDYDLIGLSYYPIWHGKNLTNVQSTVNTLGNTYGKNVLIAETAYPFTLEWDDWTNNVVGDNNQLVTGYAATLQGQKDFLLKIRNIVNTVPKGAGFCYWGAEWVSFKGDEATDGSTWENQALFDFDNKAVPALDAFLN